MKKLDKRLILSRALLFTGGMGGGFCVCCIDSAPWLGCIGTLAGILLVLAAQIVEAGK